MRTIRSYTPSRACDYDDDIPFLPHLTVDDGADGGPAYTGLLGPCGNPVVRLVAPTLPMGFLADHSSVLNADLEYALWVDGCEEDPA
jgi:hypothetical protein